MNTEPLGPLSYANWKAQVAGTPSRVAYEYPMFTDSHIVGDGIEGYGPYQFINCCKHPNVHHPRPTLM